MNPPITQDPSPETFQKRQQLAWFVMVGSFGFFLLLLVLVPYGTNAYFNNATRPLQLMLNANNGTVGITDPAGNRLVLLPDEPPREVEIGAMVFTNVTATGLFTILTPDEAQILARLQLYSNTEMDLFRAEQPRFALSDQFQQARLYLNSGRVRVTLPEVGERPFHLTLITPHTTVYLRQTGQYSIEVNGTRTQVAVQEGEAAIQTANETLMLTADQRAVIAQGEPIRGPLTTERNLVQNGDFSQGLSRWSLFAWRLEREDQPSGMTEVRQVDGIPALHIARAGQGHADVKVRQTINQDVIDFQSLRLNVTFRIVYQSLEVCGIRGSECPLFVLINYIDSSGIGREFQHGFYVMGTPTDDDGGNPGACMPCALIQRDHERIPANQFYFLELDIHEELARQGFAPPSFIDSISLISSGHSFEVDVVDVALIAQE
ncbi:MAG: FecR domain-containing protein [Chloroflexota bacterium]